MSSVFRLALINPNTDAGHTAAMGEGGRGHAARRLRGDGGLARPCPSSIESAVDSAVAAAEVVSLMRSLPAHDACLIACFGEPGLDAARELTDAPVVGMGEAAMRAAALVSARFGVITTLPRGIPAIEAALDRQGLRGRCAGVVPLDIPVAEQGGEHPETTAAIVAAGRRLVEQKRAEALVLACGGMADVAERVTAGVGVPVCDGVAFGAMLAYSLWRCGLRTSKAGAHGWPEPISYLGHPGFGSPAQHSG